MDDNDNIDPEISDDINETAEVNQEWLESLDDLFDTGGADRVRQVLAILAEKAAGLGASLQRPGVTDYVNTILPDDQPPYPGSREIERRIKSIIRWNAMAMVVRANREESGIGGHISTYASSATLYEVAFNHFFRAPNEEHPGDIVYFQGHAAPGIYARAFLEGRLSEKDLENFRRELRPAGGLPSYPHPWLMPGFWEFPTVSMGLGPIMSIYQARFNRYLENRSLKKPTDQKVWAFLGDGELDEPESLGAITLASRERLDNLIWVVNCNLQRLDGPVRGNAKIIQELEAIFTGAGWNVIKVIWGTDWDHLLEKDHDGKLVRIMNETPDGQYQKYSVSDGDYIRKDFFGRDAEVLEMVKHLSDEDLHKLKRGGHDPVKVYAAYKAAVEHKGRPTVILAKTIKGYGLGEAGEGKNITHQQKKLNEEELREFRSHFGIPISDGELSEAPFYRPENDTPEIKYLLDRRKELGGYVPGRTIKTGPVKTPPEELFEEYYEGTSDREVSTTMVFVHILSKLLNDEKIGKYIIPIVPDEARTFGMESLFRKFGIYSSVGQLYVPVDKDLLMFYNERKDGTILEEGITEAGSMSSFIAAGTAYATHGINCLPFFLYYSMFGLQRVGDLVWAAGDIQAKGFMVGCTSGRTTLAGEGLQHQDGNSHILALPVPNLKAYDPAFAYELAVIVRDGIYRMFEKQENIFYYITAMNEFYHMPPMPEGEHIKEGILKGLYKFKASQLSKSESKTHLFGSGAIMNEAIKAQKILEEKYKVAADVWSVTSYKELYYNAMMTERSNMLHPDKEPEMPYITQALGNEKGVFVAASDYIKALPASIAKWIPGRYEILGTDGFGRSDGRASLRDFFEVDARYIALAALYALANEKKINMAVVQKAIKELNINPDKSNPMIS
ncbi:MAG: pyruvate dehydrogenase (acetyl-transferring), homodimeric type [candidate division Zixibacteria bacterium HGW-Zixibacteria-1]|nr:MAG: pyruvate dehydrogenase (acetyl-transferring), homodimeric type [candidate division Zixibacteria bacterium HGW-Zixibacteria-1]